MFKVVRDIGLKLFLMILAVAVIDQTFRDHVLLSPDAVVEKYMKSVSTATFHNSKEEVENQCKKNKYISNEENSVQQNAYFLLKSQDANDKNIFLCAAPKVTSRQTIDYMQKIFNVKCGAGSLEGCQVGFDDQGESNTTVSAVLVRHPFDRLIMEFRHQRMTLTGPARVQSRKILFARYRNGNKWKKKGKKSSNEFRQFIKSSVLTPNSTILPISQICNVCSRDYELYLKLDDGLLHVNDLYNLARSHKSKPKVELTDNKKKFGPKLQRKYFSSITAEEMELLVNKFLSDFLLFGYSFETYKKALKN